MRILTKVARLGSLCFFGIALSACLGMPQKVKPVQEFNVQRYMGKWYEIARLDNRFERGLKNITAEYSLRDDGGVNVLNRGYSADEQSWTYAQGKAFFVGSEKKAYLKVSFFGPFYGSYVVFGLGDVKLAKNEPTETSINHDGEELSYYDYAFVSGPDHSYLWFLARKPFVSDALMEKFKKTAKDAGFQVDKLIYVEHDSARQ